MPRRPKAKRSPVPIAVKEEKAVATRPVMLLVLGPHRSGTSLTARMLECLGAENSRNQIPAQPDNPKGFFEDADIYHFNEAVLLPCLRQHWAHSRTVDWSGLSKTERSRLGLQALEILRRNYPLSKRLSVLKEPRINNTLPFWLSLMEHAGFDVRVVCVVRDPVSVARSLQARNGFTIARGGMVYLSAWLSILPHLQDRNTAFVHYDEIFASPGKSLQAVARALSLPLPEDFEQRIHEFSSSHLDPGMRHSAVHRDDVQLEPDLLPPTIDLYRALLDAAQSQNVRKTAKFLSRAETFLANISPLLADYDATTSAADTARSELDSLRHQQAQLQADLAAARQSSLVTALEELQGQHSSLSTLHSSLVTRHTSLVTSHDDLATRLAAAEASKQELALLQSDLADRHRALVEQQLSTEADRDRLFAEREELLRQLASLDASHSGLLTELRSQSASLAAERDGIAARLSSVEAEQASTSAAAAAEREAKSKAEEQLKDTAEENDLLLNQLHQVQEELEKYFLENRDLKQQHEALATRQSSIASERDALIARVSSLESENSKLATALEQLQGAQTSLVTTQEALVAERDSLVVGHEKLEANLHSTLEQNRTLADNVAARFQELAVLAKTIAEKDDELRRAKEASYYRGANGCLIGQVGLGDAREHPPHNHLNITLRHVQVGDSRWETLRIRLVEHHGRPGLVIFEPQTGGTPLKKWTRSGTENGVPYYLLVPEDNTGRALLDETAGADFYFLQFLVGVLEAELIRASALPGLPTGRAAALQGWLPRATSLREVFDQQSRAVFRHGPPRARLAPDESKAVQVTLPDCYFDGRFFPIVEFTWKPEEGALVFSSKDHPVPLFVGTEALRNWSSGSAVEVRFESKAKTANPAAQIPAAGPDTRLAEAIAQKLPQLLAALPSALQRKARGLGRGFLGETKIVFRRPAHSSRS